MRLLSLGMGIGLIVLPSMAQLDIKKIEKMVKEIQGQRKSKRKIDFIKMSSPFLVLIPPKENNVTIVKRVERRKKVLRFTLGAIVNQKAYINGRWVKIGENILGYKVEKIDQNKVLLKRDKKEIQLYLPRRERNNLLKVSEG